MAGIHIGYQMEPATEIPLIQNAYICILAGGSGTRLWPLSRKQTPKQLLTLTSDRSMLQLTVDRVRPLVPIEHILVLTDPDHCDLIAAHVPEIPSENILTEPSARGTAPALGLAAFRLRKRLPGDTVMISLHADHVIAKPERFLNALRTAITTAQNGYLVTIGVVPHYPETGYGYIERGTLLKAMQELQVYRIARFREKPPLATAQEYVATGRYDWNTGYFTWTLDTILQAFAELQPTIYSQLAAISVSSESVNADEILRNTWNQIERTTIDVGIMEKATNAAVVSCDLGWNDVGSWASLYDILPHDIDENVILGTGEHLEVDTQNCLVYRSGRFVVSLGVKDLIIVDTGDALLILPRERAQEVGDLVRKLQKDNLVKYL
jgi:mannose-1-phosphate guanylyltransferase